MTNHIIHPENFESARVYYDTVTLRHYGEQGIFCTNCSKEVTAEIDWGATSAQLKVNWVHIEDKK